MATKNAVGNRENTVGNGEKQGENGGFWVKIGGGALLPDPKTAVLLPSNACSEPENLRFAGQILHGFLLFRALRSVNVRRASASAVYAPPNDGRAFRGAGRGQPRARSILAPAKYLCGRAQRM